MLPMGAWGNTKAGYYHSKKKSISKLKPRVNICEKVLLSSPGPKCGVYVFDQKNRKCSFLFLSIVLLGPVWCYLGLLLM